MAGSIVQKYGGTSVGTPQRIMAIARRIAQQRQQGLDRVAVVVSAMAGETNRLVELVRQVNPQAPAKSYDMAVAAGEQVSVGLLAAALEGAGVPSEPLLAHQVGILTDPFHGKARIHAIDTKTIEACWRAGKVPVVAGFQGMTAGQAVTTLGRGGSDTSAVALAVALQADFCEINTDVDGVYTADPRVVPTARRILRLDYEVALELAALGSKVLHSRCVELGAKWKMPIIVRSSFDEDESRRTELMSFSPQEALEAPVVSGVTLDRQVAKITVRGLNADVGAISEIFKRVAALNVNVDIIVHDKDERAKALAVGFTVGQGDIASTMAAIEGLKKERKITSMEVETVSGLAKVSAVGLGMRSHSGVAASVFETLAANGIEVLMISTSEIKISCVVGDTVGERATQVLHKLFFN